MGRGNRGRGGLDLAPRAVTIGTGNLCHLAVLGAIGLAWAASRTLPASYRLVVHGHRGFRMPLVAIGSISTCLLCWSLWNFEGTLCTLVLIGGFALTDGAILVSGLWHHSGGRLLRALGRARQPA